MTLKQLVGTNSATIEPNYSGFTLIDLFIARYWIDKLPGETSLEDEIQKRCEHIQQQMNVKTRVTGARGFKPYGLRVALVFFCLTVGPFLIVTFLNGIRLLKDVDDAIALSGVWAVVTSPALVMISMVGGRIDAERIIKCFNLSGHTADDGKEAYYAVVNAL